MYHAIAPALLASVSPLPLPVAVVQVADIELPDTVSAGTVEQAQPAGEQTGPNPLTDAPDSGEVHPGDIIRVQGTVLDTPGDPLENLNAQTFELTQKVDQAIVGPIAGVYEDDLPKPVRNGLRNVLRNLLEPVNFLNFILQLKPGKAFETLGRFALNTTAGFGGLFDVAATEQFNLPYRRNGFANTLGYYGVGPGPFMVLPLVGATTLRDLVGNTLDQAVVPFIVGPPLDTPYYAIPAYTVNSLQYRIEVDERLAAIRASDDPYMATRESYLCLREADIAKLRNRPPPRDCSIDALMAAADPYYEDELDEVAEEPAAAPVEAAVIDMAPVPAPEPVIEFVAAPVIQPAP
ncbi:VacJ family lipoprotein [Altererythrobacter sp. KTW20L]|uniref:MlaA family lipoprotein n=1 Tax=Altererythrobacter sp. KTW20L TaxID=2942210 RepID=UPI0020BF37C9|nr:VacJ family lipoprotein [Altererythrobacter sp. KTW20L]MCL6250700.1 VacJ family lipoprotein [Altererythrobacter sp. KTW20L]